MTLSFLNRAVISVIGPLLLQSLTRNNEYNKYAESDIFMVITLNSFAFFVRRMFAMKMDILKLVSSVIHFSRRLELVF